MDQLSNKLFFRLFQTANTLHKAGTRALESKQVTTPQWSVLGALSREQAVTGMSVAELSDYLMVSRQNISVILKRMEQRGLIERTVDLTDQRSRRIQLTKQGKSLWQEITPMISEFYSSALEKLSYDDRISFVHNLNKLLASMTQMEANRIN